jgi:hypothetical protein
MIFRDLETGMVLLVTCIFYINAFAVCGPKSNTKLAKNPHLMWMFNFGMGAIHLSIRFIRKSRFNLDVMKLWTMEVR